MAGPRDDTHTPAAPAPGASEPDPPAALGAMEAIASSLRATQEALTDCLDVAATRRSASQIDSSLPHPVARILAEVALVLETGRERLLQVVKTLPGDVHYAPFAERLRLAAASHPELEALVREAPKVAAPLVDGVRALTQVAADLHASRERLAEAGRSLSAQWPLSGLQVEGALREIQQVSAGLREDWERTLGPVRDLGKQLPALTHAASKIEVLVTLLADSAHQLKAPLESPAFQSLTAEVEAVTASLRAVGELATPLVDSLADFGQMAVPAAERLQAGAEPAPAKAAPVLVRGEDPAAWAADILRSIQELRLTVSHGPAPAGEQEQRLWEHVRHMQAELVNLRGTLLAPKTKRIGE